MAGPSTIFSGPGASVAGHAPVLKFEQTAAALADATQLESTR